MVAERCAAAPVAVGKNFGAHGECDLLGAVATESSHRPVDTFDVGFGDAVASEPFGTVLLSAARPEGANIPDQTGSNRGEVDAPESSQDGLMSLLRGPNRPFVL